MHSILTTMEAREIPSTSRRRASRRSDPQWITSLTVKLPRLENEPVPENFFDTKTVHVCRKENGDLRFCSGHNIGSDEEEDYRCVRYPDEPDPWDGTEYVQQHLTAEQLKRDPRLCRRSFKIAIHTYNTVLLKRLLEMYRPPRTMGYELIRVSARLNNLDAVRCLVGFGYSVNRPRGSSQRQPTPLHFALHHDNCKMLKVLVNAGVDMNAKFKGKMPVYETKPGPPADQHELLCMRNVK